MRVMILTGVAFFCALQGYGQTETPDAREIVRRSVTADSRSLEIRRDYTYKVLDVVKEADSAGNTKATHSTLSEVLYIGGRPYHHPLERDGKPLPKGDAEKAKAALDKAVQAASRLSPEERKAREDQYTKARAKDREQFKYIPEAFELRIVGEVSVEGRDAWQIQASPKPEYKGPFAFVFHNMEGTLWIDKRDFQWVKVEADSLNTISFGWFLARIAKGTRLSIENMRLNDELWAPKRFTIHASARLALVKKLTAEQETTFSDYRKFKTDSRMLEVPGEK